MKTRSHRKNRKQHGGSCAAMPQMNQAFPQRGGMAPISQGDSYLLDAATRVQAEVGPLDKSFMELPSVIPRQTGGRRKSRRSGRKTSGRKSRRSGRKSRRASGRKGRRSCRKGRRTQRGGMMDFDAAYRYAPPGAYAGENPQIHTEQTVNHSFKIAGPQA
jgi:hypothetical protein